MQKQNTRIWQCFIHLAGWLRPDGQVCKEDFCSRINGNKTTVMITVLIILASLTLIVATDSEPTTQP